MTTDTLTPPVIADDLVTPTPSNKPVLPHPRTPAAERAEPLTLGRTWLICGVLMALAAIFRLFLMSTIFAHIDSDQAVLGIMAYDIQKGAHPVFYYGQPYMGSLEAYMAALFFSLFGANDLTVRLPALIFSVLFVGVIYWLGLTVYGRAYGRRIALWSGLFLAFGPPILTGWSTAAGAGYIDVAFFGALLFLLAIRYPNLQSLPGGIALAGGLLLGLGVWTEPLIVDYLPPLATLYALRLWLQRREFHRHYWLHVFRNLLLCAAGSAIGALPFLIYNVQQHWVTVGYLLGKSVSGNHIVVAAGFFTQSLPVLLGLATPTTPNANPNSFVQLISEHPILYGAGLLLTSYVVVRLARPSTGLVRRITGLWRPLSNGNNGTYLTSSALGEGVLALFVIICVASFIFSNYGARYLMTSMPRYLIPLYTATPLLLACTMPRRVWVRSAWIGTSCIGLLCACGLITASAMSVRPSISALASALEHVHVRIVYTNYWTAYRLMFETHERVIGIPTSSAALARIRISADLSIAQHTPTNQIAWVIAADSHENNIFQWLLRYNDTQAKLITSDGKVIYYALSRPLRASPTSLVDRVSPYARAGF